ncbi:MAG: hypothetical protein RLO52_12750 [Sandaracinaceae bacterium]|nr:MAG: hypothetical protein EVA89_35350 [Sandaracinaceae bacterium]HBQ12296.1 hypothetical protein [Myxococcales bacterium]
MTSSDEIDKLLPRAGGDLEAQLVSLYQDRAKLFRELGTADPDDIIAMVRRLEAQLVSLYEERERAFLGREVDET